MTNSSDSNSSDSSDGPASSGSLGQGLLPANFRSRLDLGASTERDSRDTGPFVTSKAFILGLFFAAFIGGGVSYTTLYLQGSFMALGFSTVGAVFLLFLLAGAVNPLVKSIKPRWALQQGELLLVYIMMVMASPIPG